MSIFVITWVWSSSNGPDDASPRMRWTSRYNCTANMTEEALRSGRTCASFRALLYLVQGVFELQQLSNEMVDLGRLGLSGFSAGSHFSWMFPQAILQCLRLHSCSPGSLIERSMSDRVGSSRKSRGKGNGC